MEKLHEKVGRKMFLSCQPNAIYIKKRAGLFDENDGKSEKTAFFL